jgi:hypothetical protein
MKVGGEKTRGSAKEKGGDIGDGTLAGKYCGYSCGSGNDSGVI